MLEREFLLFKGDDEEPEVVRCRLMSSLRLIRDRELAFVTHSDSNDSSHGRKLCGVTGDSLFAVAPTSLSPTYAGVDAGRTFLFLALFNGYSKLLSFVVSRVATIHC